MFRKSSESVFAQEALPLYLRLTMRKETMLNHIVAIAQTEIGSEVKEVAEVLSKPSFWSHLKDSAVNAGEKLLLALVIFVIGRLLIRALMAFVMKLSSLRQSDPTVQHFLHNFIETVLYVILIISLVNLLGIPMASIITVLASCGVAIGLAMQGALGNIAGGLMLLFFHPFKAGDYIKASDVEGTVAGISLVYTELLSVDHKRITIPNGSLMNANVVNYSIQQHRRVDIEFKIGREADLAKVKDLMRAEMKKNTLVLQERDNFVGLTGAGEGSLTVTSRSWCLTKDYWTLYSQLYEGITERFRKEGIPLPAVRITKLG